MILTLNTIGIPKGLSGGAAVICGWCGWNRIPPRSLASFITQVGNIPPRSQTFDIPWKIMETFHEKFFPAMIITFPPSFCSLNLLFYKLCGIIFKNKQSWMIQFSLFSFPEVRNSQGYKCALCYKRVWQVGHKSRKQGEGSCGSWGSTLGLVIIVKQTCASTHPLLFRHTQHNSK